MPIIAFVGIPGAGATTLTKFLGKGTNCCGHFLSEEDEKTDSCDCLKDNYAFGLRMKFRLERIKHLYMAQKQSENGQIVFIDGYYDKLMRFYLGEKGCRWLMKSSDPYFKVAKEISYIDYRLLPDIDVIIGLRVSFDVWIHFLKNRGRPLDLNVDFQKECFLGQDIFLNIAKQYCVSHDKIYLEIWQEVNQLEHIVENIKLKLKKIGVLYV